MDFSLVGTTAGVENAALSRRHSCRESGVSMNPLSSVSENPAAENFISLRPNDFGPNPKNGY
jgi:hypothetical protein